MSPPVVATIGTTHPLGFAGLLFGALALAETGARPVCVVAGVTAQDGGTVLMRRALDGPAIAAQFEALHASGVAAFHVGALLSADAVRSVAAGLAGYPGIPVVVDPVLVASTGDRLADDDVIDALRASLFPRATLVTPNIDEASTFMAAPVNDRASMEAAARACVRWGAHAALIKGGHFDGEACDVRADADGVRWFAQPRVVGAMRGTGDLLAVSIAAALAGGVSLDVAIVAARARVAAAIAAAVPFAGTRAMLWKTTPL